MGVTVEASSERFGEITRGRIPKASFGSYPDLVGSGNPVRSSTTRV